MTAPSVDEVTPTQNKPQECQIFAVKNVRLTSVKKVHNLSLEL